MVSGNDLKQTNADALAAISTTATLDALESLRVHYLGKKGVLTEQMKTLGGLPPEERKAFGAELNAAKDALAAALAARKETLEAQALQAQLAREWVDVSLPIRPEGKGSIHPISQVVDEVIAIFAELGFEVALGPEIEDDFHNFTALNIPEDHPARQMHDTFYLNAERDGRPLLLRTHTSPVQIRTMLKQKPPIRILAPGPTYRCDSDITHTPMFHQVEGLVIDRAIHMGHLKGCLIHFVQRFFGVEDVPVRFRNSFFPFTEPSAEMDIGCERKEGKLTIGKGADWLEILGCGMVHPKVLEHGGIDPNEWQGFAFGMGIERLAMLKYGIPDLRTFFDADTRWLHHYGFAPLDIPGLPEARTL
jgi:phenylalanyl-tRNA synthetase alpha chain